MITTNNGILNERLIAFENFIAWAAWEQTPLSSQLMAAGQISTCPSTKVTWQENKLKKSSRTSGVKEGAEFEATSSVERISHSNNCQIFSETAEVSGSALAASNGISGLQDLMAEEVSAKNIDIKNRLEVAIICGTKKDEDSESGRQMDGLLNQAGITVDCEGFLKDDHVRNLMLQHHQAGVSGHKRLYVHSGTKYLFNDLFTKDSKAVVSLVPGTNEGGYIINRIHTDFGVLDIYLNDAVPPGQALIINFADIELKRMNNRDFKTIDVPTTTDSKAKAVVGEYSIIAKKSAAVSKLINILPSSRVADELIA